MAQDVFERLRGELEAASQPAPNLAREIARQNIRERADRAEMERQVGELFGINEFPQDADDPLSTALKVRRVAPSGEWAGNILAGQAAALTGLGRTPEEALAAGREQMGLVQAGAAEAYRRFNPRIPYLAITPLQLGADLVSLYGGGVALRGGLTLAKALSLRFAPKVGAKLLGSTTLPLVERGMGGAGSMAAMGAGGGAFRSFEQGRPVAEGAGRGALISGGMGALLFGALPGGAIALGKLSGAVERVIAGSGLRAVYGEAGVQAMRRYAPALGEEGVDLVARTARNMGLKQTALEELARRVASEVSVKGGREALDIFVLEQADAMAASLGYARALPAYTWSKTAEHTLAVLRQGKDSVKRLFPLPAEWKEAIGRGFDKTGQWLTTRVKNLADVAGIPTPEAVHHSLASLREFYGSQTFWRMMSERETLTRLSKLTPQERERLGMLTAGMVEKRAGAPAAVREPEIGALETGRIGAAERSALLAERGQRIAAEGELTAPEMREAIRGDPILSPDAKAAGLRAMELRRWAEDLSGSQGFKVHGKGIYRGRLWVEQQIEEAANTGRAIGEPVRLGIRGRAFQARTHPILEIDQREGGAWWVIKSPHGKERVVARAM